MPKKIDMRLLFVALPFFALQCFVAPQFMTARALAQEANQSPVVWEPKVVFSTEQEQTCLLKVGDEFPQVELPNLTGDMFDLGDRADGSLTVIAFWHEKPVAGVQLRNTIVRYVGPTGVGLISIYVGDHPEAAQRISASDADGTGTHLMDKGELWNQVATDEPPRVFLLQGRKVVWMDNEYSLATQHELLNAIRHFSAKAPAE